MHTGEALQWPRMKRSNFIPVVLSACAFCLSGCFTNYYKEHYIPHENELLQQFSGESQGNVQLALVTTEKGVMKCIEAGYIPLGTASFAEMHCPWFFAIEQAEDVGADLVLLEERFSHTTKRPSVIFLPSYSTTYHSGSASVSSYGTGGYGTAYGTYSGTSTQTTISAQHVEVPVQIFQQDALFLRKGNYGSFYGALLDVPQRLPDEPFDKRINVSVFAVLKGSAADKDGLKQGQRVAKINGVPVTTYKSIEPFLKDMKSIRSVEVVK